MTKEELENKQLIKITLPDDWGQTPVFGTVLLQIRIIKECTLRTRLGGCWNFFVL